MGKVWARLKFVVPFAHKVRYRYRRHRITRDAIVTSVVPVEIEEVDAPGEPAFVLGHMEQPPIWALAAWPRFLMRDGKPLRVWRLQDGFYVEFCAVGEFLDLLAVGETTPFDARCGGISAKPFGNEGDLLTRYDDLSAKGIIASWEVVDEAERSDVIAARSSALRVIDGMVCAPVGEPIIVVEDEPSGVRMAFAEGVVDRRGGFDVEPEGWQGRRYDVDHFAEAEAYAERLAAIRGQRFINGAHLQFASEPSLRLPIEGEHFYQLAWRLLVSVQRAFEGRNLPAYAAWLELQEALNECPKNQTTDMMAKSVERMLCVIDETIQSVRVAGNAAVRDLLALIPQVETHLHAWRERDACNHDWSETALPVAANRSYGTEQLLSDVALGEAAMICGLDLKVAAIERAAGNLLFIARSNQSGSLKQRVFAVSPDLVSVRVLGRAEAPTHIQEFAGLEWILARNRRIRDDFLAMSDLGL